MPCTGSVGQPSSPAGSWDGSGHSRVHRSLSHLSGQSLLGRAMPTDGLGPSLVSHRPPQLPKSASFMQIRPAADPPRSASPPLLHYCLSANHLPRLQQESLCCTVQESLSVAQHAIWLPDTPDCPTVGLLDCDSHSFVCRACHSHSTAEAWHVAQQHGANHRKSDDRLHDCSGSVEAPRQVKRKPSRLSLGPLVLARDAPQTTGGVSPSATSGMIRAHMQPPEPSNPPGQPDTQDAAHPMSLPLPAHQGLCFFSGLL